eukprot:TRINITY_DN1064_c0_g1_i1.p1 TRINITY_DN1064_c0_g1~~TRINITY_DN1064_c0_g1_i1.p1  ORF type:complete len:658 (+),score=157.27 TRINITY_DN1064_c0_g1_i1:81-2054(+)
MVSSSADQCYRFRSNLMGFRQKAMPHETPVIADEGLELIKVINKEVEFARQKLAKGDVRPAITQLRQALRLANSHAKDPTVDDVLKAHKVKKTPTAAQRLALAIVHLNYCQVLAAADRHSEALEQARASILAVDGVWYAIMQQLAEKEDRRRRRNEEEAGAVDEEGEEVVSKPAQRMRELLQNPPAWLEQAACVTVEARQALVSEAETLALLAKQKSVHCEEEEEIPPTVEGSGSRPGTSGEKSRPSTSGEKSRPSTSGETPSATEGKAPDDPPADKEEEKEEEPSEVAQEADRLRSEAAIVAQNLLHEEHPVRLRAEHAQQDADKLREVFKSKPVEKHRGYLDTSGLPPILHMRNTSRLPLKQQRVASMPNLMRKSGQSLDPHATANSTKTWVSSFTGMSSGGLSVDQQVGLSYPNCFRGDVYPTGLPLKPKRSLSRPMKKGKKEEAEEEATQSLPKYDPVTGERINIFKDWILHEMNHLGKLNLTEMMMRTEEGQQKLKYEMQRSSAQFKTLEIPTYSDTALYEGRIVYTDYAMPINERNFKRREAVRSERIANASHAVAAHERCKKLMSYYGLDYDDKKGFDLPTLNKVFKESHDRTPYAIGERKRVAEEKRKKEAEERAVRFAALRAQQDEMDTLRRESTAGLGGRRLSALFS